MEVINVKGSFYESGVQLGTMFKAEIAQFVDNRFKLAYIELKGEEIEFDKRDYYQLSGDLLESLATYTLNEYEEIQGVSDACGIDKRDIVFALGYSDIFDLMMSYYGLCDDTVRRSDECTSFIVHQSNISRNVYTGQTWDMPPNTHKYAVLIHKMPNSCPDFYSYTPVLGLTYMGLSEIGICIGTTNLSTRDTNRKGVIFPALIQSALTQDGLERAINVFEQTPKTSGHYYYIANPVPNTYAIEVSASRCVVRNIVGGIYTHTNHYDNDIFANDAINYSGSSESRCTAMQGLLANVKQELNKNLITDMLSDHDKGICRHPRETDFTETSGAVIFVPAEKTMTAIFGFPCSPREVVEVEFP